MKLIENLNNIWYKQDNDDVLNLSGTTNVYGNINILGNLKVNNDFGHTKSVIFNNYTGNTLNLFTKYTGDTQNILNKTLILKTNINSYVIHNDIKLGINNDNPEALLDIFTTGKTTGFRLVDGNQSNGRILTTNDKGFGSWKPIVNSFRSDLSLNGTLLNHNLNKLPSIVTFYGNDRSLNFEWSYNKSGLNQYNQIFIYSNINIKDVIINII
jgi:hypothetical protein